VTIGKTIKAARERRGLNQRDCAKLLKVAQSTLSDWENGAIAPRPRRLGEIADALGIKASKLRAGLFE